jgi:predicted site-specific integrase-resolvase
MKDTKPRGNLNSLDEAASILGISISTLRSHITGGAVDVVRLGGRIFVHDRELTRIQTEGIPTKIADYKPKATSKRSKSGVTYGNRKGIGA